MGNIVFRDVPSKAEILHWASIQEVLGGFAHEIAQPLNAIMIASQVIQLRIDRSSLSEAEKAFLVHRLNIVVSQVDRASTLVQTFRGFSRGDSLKAEVLDTARLYDRVKGLMDQQFVVRGIKLVLDRADSLPAITKNCEIIECAMVQAFAFAREAIGAIMHWHESQNSPYDRILLVELQTEGQTQTIRLAWHRGELPEETQLYDPATHGGIQIALILLSELGCSLTVRDGEVLIRIPCDHQS